MSGEDMGDINRATTNLEASLSSLAEAVEEHPDLAVSGEVKEFLAVLQATGEEVSADRLVYNEKVREYNRAIGSFPADLWTDNWHFTEREYFTAKIGDAEPPPVPAE